MKQIRERHHKCINCGNEISSLFDFCTTVAFGRESSPCKAEYERFLAKMSAHTLVLQPAMQSSWRALSLSL